MARENDYETGVKYVEVNSQNVEATLIADAISKRDTAAITSQGFNVTGMKTKRLYVRNTLDQGFNIKTEVFYGGIWFPAGSPKTLAANSGITIYDEADTQLIGMKMINGQVRFVVDTFASAPTSGALTIEFDMMPV